MVAVNHRRKPHESQRVSNEYKLWFAGYPIHYTLIYALNIGSILYLSVQRHNHAHLLRNANKHPTLKTFLDSHGKKPLYAILSSVVGLAVIILIAQITFGLDIPLVGTSKSYFASQFTMGANISVLVSSAFQWPLYLAAVAAGLCITARIYHRKVSRLAVSV
jgi:hypothetical protein